MIQKKKKLTKPCCCLSGCCLDWVSWCGRTGFGFLTATAGLTWRTTMEKCSPNHRTYGLLYPSLSASWLSGRYLRGALSPTVTLNVLSQCQLTVNLPLYLICIFLSCKYEVRCKQCFYSCQDSIDSSCLPAGRAWQETCLCSSKFCPGGSFLQHIKASDTGNHPAMSFR